jgi:hypothetical protein
MRSHDRDRHRSRLRGNGEAIESRELGPGRTENGSGSASSSEREMDDRLGMKKFRPRVLESGCIRVASVAKVNGQAA